MNMYLALLLVIISYLLGSIPHALIVSKLTMGIDIREHGSKNMGATNTLRVLGVKWGLIVLFLDALKAAIVVAVVNYNLFGIRELVFHPLIYGIFAILGHLYPVFCKFKGGKGIAATAGLMFAVDPLICLTILIIFLAIFLTTKYVSLGSLVIMVVFAVELIIFGQHGRYALEANELYEMYALAIVLAIMGWWRHRANIERLLKGTENKINFSKIKK